MTKPEAFYITTAIDYPNGSPHMGHAYEKVVSDFYARWYRQLGAKTRYLTGTDENGQKLIQAAEKAGQETGPYVDEQVQTFKDLCQKLNITNDDFIRTTEERHHKVCHEIWSKLKEKDYIYFDEYSGMYCYSCENFYTETQAEDGKCPEHRIPLVEKSEKGYFFKLSEFRDFLLDHYKKNPDFISNPRAKKEIISRLEKEELRDLAVSRPSQGWGVPVPGDENFVLYTWFDALINYYSALEGSLRDEYWPAQSHVIGKDIVWFHTVIWPAMLKACDIALPDKVYVHGMVLAADGKKMSKSLGNGVDPIELLEKYPVDTFRFYLLKAISAKNDGPFSEADLMERHNTELGNDFGNLLMRVVKLSMKKVSPKMNSDEAKQEIFLEEMHHQFHKHVENFDHHLALETLWEKIRATNQYINQTEPWKVKDNPQRLHEILFNCLYSIHCFAYHLAPAMPDIAKKVCDTLGVNGEKSPVGQFKELSYQLTEPEILFTKFELSK